jgi:hypothetical protein
MPAYAIGEKAADLIKGTFLQFNDGEVKLNAGVANLSVNGNGTVFLN